MPRTPAFIIESPTTLHTWPAMFEHAPAEWHALLEWCRVHGLDPERMPADNVIDRDLDHCRVVYDEYVMSADEVQDRAARWREYPDMPPRRRVHAQGETPPMPFPDVILRHLSQTPSTPEPE